MFIKRKQHKIALQIAQEKQMESSYLYARQQGLSPIEALEEFDLLTPQAMTQLTRTSALKGNKVYASSRMCTDGRSPQRY